MSGKANTTVSSAKSKLKDKQVTRSGRAGLTFPVGRVVSCDPFRYDRSPILSFYSSIVI